MKGSSVPGGGSRLGLRLEAEGFLTSVFSFRGGS